MNDAAPSAAPADAAARAAALDPARSFIVQAPAGSGKTELLTQRLLVLLARVDEPEEVMAMTFTRKAASEMRHRVYAAIRAALEAEAAGAAPPAAAHARRTRELAQAVLARSRARAWRLEDSPQRLRVLTIDALCAQIAQQAPLTAGFGGRVEIADQPEPLYREAARAAMAALEHDPARAAPVARVLRHFDNRTDVLENQLVALLARREQWLALASRDARRARPRTELEAALDWCVRSALAQAAARVPESLRQAWCESAAYAAQQLAAEDPEHPLHAVRRAGWPAAEPAAVAQWEALIRLVCTAQGQWRKQVNVSNGFPPGGRGADGEAARRRKAAHLQLIAALGAEPDLLEALQALCRLPQPRYSDAQWEVLQALLDTLLLAAGYLRVVFAERGAVDFAEMAMRALDALGEPEAPSELGLRLDYRVRHLLVDEFQDTAELQWQLLLRLTAGWTGDDGRTLFLVGDPMQSIYRFRQAEVGIFLRAQRDGVGALRCAPLTLTANFRSRAGVVDWVNAVFARVLPQVEDANRGAVRYSPADAVHPAEDGEAVRLLPAVALGDADEAREAVACVQAHRAAAPDDSIAILVRSRGHLAAIAPALRAAGIACRAVEIEGLSERPVIADLRALTWALLHPLDRSAWLATLRAPWCALTLADLHALCAELPPAQSLLSALRDAQRRQRLSSDGAARLAPVHAALEAALAELGRLPLARCVEGLWLALGGPACAGDAAALADAQVFFDCLARIAPGAWVEDPDALDRALAELRASPAPTGADAVQLMTIHKSKGLEFDCVVVPGLGRNTRSDDTPLIAWAQLTDVDGQSRLLLAPVHATGEERDPTFDYVRALEADKQRLEDARLLYVAATRARRRLHLIGSVPLPAEGEAGTPPARSLLARLWPAVQERFAQIGGSAQPAAAAAPLAREETHLDAPPLRRLVGWLPPDLSADALPLADAAGGETGEGLRFDWAGETARCIGVVYHRWVQHIAAAGIDGWPAGRCAQLAPALIDDLRREGVPAARAAAAAARVQRALENTLSDPRGRWLLAPGGRSELAVSEGLDGRVRRLVIDRSLVDADGTRWIVDFKTSSHEGGDAAGFVRRELERYRAQLLRYAAALRRLDARPLRAALYLPLIEPAALRWIELDL